MNDVEFEYSIPMDANRYEDGIDLRYKFGREFGYSDSTIANLLDDHECSVLEMMVALSHRCEESIMDDPEIGNRTYEWFGEMVNSLGLDIYDDRHFNNEAATRKLITFINRDYKPNGEGGLFTIKHPMKDLRNIEIWYQMMWYLNEITK